MFSAGVANLLMVVILTLGASVTSFFLPNNNNSLDSDCLSQDNNPGVCTEITSCQSLGDFFEKPITKEKRKFLEVSTCGFANDVPKICCPIDTRNLSNRRTIKTATTTTTPTTTPTTTNFRITEETTEHNPFTQPSEIGNSLRRGTN